MPDKRTSFNLPDATRQQLEDLARVYGTMTAAVIVAVDELWRRRERAIADAREKGQDHNE